MLGMVHLPWYGSRTHLPGYGSRTHLPGYVQDTHHPGMYRIPTTLGIYPTYTPLGTPCTPTLPTSSSMPALLIGVMDEECLGSNLRLIGKMKRIEASRLLKV